MPSPNKKRLILNLVLLAIVVVLVFFIALGKVQQDEEFKTLYDKKIGDQVTRIVIHSEGKQDVEIRNDDNIWKVEKPEEFVADKEKMHHLFTLLSENAETSYDIVGKDLKTYGLDKDRLSVSFNGTKIIFGKLNDISNKRYLLKGNKMYLISETVFGLLESGAEGFRK